MLNFDQKHKNGVTHHFRVEFSEQPRGHIFTQACSLFSELLYYLNYLKLKKITREKNKIKRLFITFKSCTTPFYVFGKFNLIVFLYEA